MMPDHCCRLESFLFLSEPRWDAQDPICSTIQMRPGCCPTISAAAKIEEIRDFSNDFPGTELAAVWTRYEGSPSYDTRYWGLIAQDSDWEPFAFLIYDLQEDTIVTREIPRGYSIDNVPSARWGIIFWPALMTTARMGNWGGILPHAV